MNDVHANAVDGERGGSSSAPAVLSQATRTLVAAVFDTPFYLAQCADSRAAQADPFTHYLETGWRQGLDPSPTFSTNGYLQANADVAAAGICPLVHYVTIGIFQGRMPQAAKSAAEARRRASPAPGTVPPVPLAERLKRSPRAPAVVPMETALLERVIAGIEEQEPAGLAMSLSHDDAFTVIGGVQNCVRDEAHVLRQKGWAYLHLCPVQPLPLLAEATPAEQFFVRLGTDQERLGAASLAALAAALARRRFGEARRALILHHLMGFAPESVAELARAFAPHETVVWLHDFFTLCPNYALLRNDVAFCNAPAPESSACSTCVYGAERGRHLARLKRLAAELNPTVLAPSDTALAFWRERSLMTYAGARALPHGVLAMGPESQASGAASETPLRVGFVGLPLYHKGWHVFEQLVRRHRNDARYAFFHLGTVAAAEASNIAFVEVVLDRARRDYMIDAVVTNGIDVVINWSLCYETFSFSAHEAIAGGAFVLAPKQAGNIVPAITRAQQGIGLDSEQELFELFASGKIFEVAKQRRYGEFIRNPATAAYLAPDR
ncbi:MAG: hypothetical protein JO328_21535 [Hyphomicrobiales bacterium]|nr:hypothetical protein [Hyphomicrobiales bacterium]